MASTATNNVDAAAFIALALAIAAMGIYVAGGDDAPGAAVIGLLLMIGAVVLGVKAARNRLPAWGARTALAVGILLAVFAAWLGQTSIGGDSIADRGGGTPHGLCRPVDRLAAWHRSSARAKEKS
jgi:peptidoglycan/LPS O-acetylase OafA/YrhL